MSTATLIRSLGQPKMLMIYNQNEKKNASVMLMMSPITYSFLR